MRSVVALAVLIAAVSLAAVPGAPASPSPGCRLLSNQDATVASGQDEVLESEHSAAAGSVACHFETGPGEPTSVPKQARFRVSLDLRLFRFSGKALKEIAAQQCSLAHKGHYPEEACTFAHKAVKASDPLRSFQLLHRSFLEMGTADKVGGLGDPAFMAELRPPLVGTELWIYREGEKKGLVATCIELHTAGKPPDNGHFPSCAMAAAHAALVKLP
jgi:hypothetical protein